MSIALDGGGMLDEWKTSVIVPNFKGKGDVRSCGSYIGSETVRTCQENCRKGTKEADMNTS